MSGLDGLGRPGLTPRMALSSFRFDAGKPHPVARLSVHLLTMARASNTAVLPPDTTQIDVFEASHADRLVRNVIAGYSNAPPVLIVLDVFCVMDLMYCAQVQCDNVCVWTHRVGQNLHHGRLPVLMDACLRSRKR